MAGTILMLSPHTDDAELGAGGSIAKFVEKGYHVEMMAFSWCDNEKLIDEVKRSAGILGVHDLKIHDFERRRFPELRQEILQVLFDYNQQNEVDIIFTPATTDLHQDHNTVTMEAMRAFKRSTILGYEIPWDNIQLTTNSFIPLSEPHVERKIEALNCYETQRSRYYFDEDYLRSILKMRGTQIQERYAEAFEVIRYVPRI